MKTAQNVPRTGLARAKGEHLSAANEDRIDPATLQRLMEPRWRYTPAAETDIRATFRRFGWSPSATRRV